MPASAPSKHRLEPFIAGLALLVLLVGCVVVLAPFWSPLLWAVVLAFTLHPLQRRFTKWFRGSRTLAACVVSLIVVLVLAGPLVWIGFSLADEGKALGEATRKWFLALPDEPPNWATSVPGVGDEIKGYWIEFADGRRHWLEQLERASAAETVAPKAVVVPPEELDVLAPGGAPAPAAAVEPPAVVADASAPKPRTDSPQLVVLAGKLLGKAQAVLIALGKAAGQGVMVFLASAFLAFFLLRDADVLGERIGMVVDRLTGGRGNRLMQVAAGTVKGVIYGILGTALVQAIVAGLGFWVAEVPGALLLGVLTFFFAIIPFGPPLVWLPATFWLFSQGRPGWGIFLAIWGTFGISGVDNVLRPALISQGSKLPFVLIFCGVVGGAVAFGLVGVFLGPTVLAVGYRLIEEWIAEPVEVAAVLEPHDG